MLFSPKITSSLPLAAALFVPLASLTGASELVIVPRDVLAVKAPLIAADTTISHVVGSPDDDLHHDSHPAVHAPAPALSSSHLAKYHLKQVTRSQLVERALKKHFKARAAAAGTDSDIKARALAPRASPVPPTTVNVASGYVDDQVFPLPTDPHLTLKLFDQTFSAYDMQMSSNGFIRFGYGKNKPDNSKLPAKGVGDVVIFPYFDDLSIPNDNFHMSYVFTDKKIVFSWQTVPYGSVVPPRTSDPAAPGTPYIHFELEYDVTMPNILVIRYLADSNPDALNGKSATIGVQNVSEQIAYTYSRNNKAPGEGKLPTNQRVAPGKSLIIDTSTGTFQLV